MKKLKLFFACLLMAVLSIGQVWAADETVTYTLTGATTVSVTGTAPDGATVSASTNGSWVTADSRLQLAGKTAEKNYTLTLSGFDGCTITGLTVKLGSNSKAGNAALTFVAGTETLASIASANLNTESWFGAWVSSGSEKNVTLSNDEYEIQEDEDVILTITNTANSAYVYYVSVTYTPAGTPGDVIVKTLKSIAVEGMTTSYETGEAFSFDGTCTATYSVTKNDVPQADESKTVTPTSVTSPDMSSAGEKTITVSYTESEVTKTTTYNINVVAAQPKSTLIFTDEYKDSGATADDDAEWNVTSDAPESTYEAARGIHFGTGSSSQVQYVQLTTSDISGTITKVVVNASDATGTAEISVSVNGTDFTCGGSTTVANTNPGSDYTFTGSASGEIVVRIDRGSAAYKAIYVKSIVVSYIAGASVKKPTFSVAGGSYLDAQNVAITCETAGASIFYTLDESDPSSASTPYTSAITISETKTLKAIAIKDEVSSPIATATYTIITPLSVTDALALIPNANDQVDNQYVEGFVCTEASSVLSGGKMTYYISADGSETNRLQIYKGKNLDNTNFSNVSDAAKGDKVIVYGQLYNFGGTNKEMNDGNYIVRRTAKGALQSVVVSGTPSKTAYSSGDAFAPAGLVVTATYASGYAINVASELEAEDWSASPATVTENGNISVTATYGGMTSSAVNVPVTVLAATLESISLSYSEVEVYQGKPLPKPVVTAHWSDATTSDVTALATFTGYDASTTGDQTITVSYKVSEGDDPEQETYTVTVNPIYGVELAASVAKDLIETVVGNTESTSDMIVRGKVSSVGSISSKCLTYFISDDGTTTNQLEIFKGKYLDNADFTDGNKLKVGDEVVVTGKVIYYNNNTAEFANGKSQVTSLARTPNFSITDVASFEVGSADLAVADLTINVEGEGAVTFASSDNTNAVTIVDGKLHAVAAGTATITANLAASGIYKAATAEFNVTVIPATVKYAITFDGNGADGGTAPTVIPDKAAGEEVTLPANSYTKTGYTFTGWKVYDENEEEVTVTANAFEMPASPVTIKAQWAEIPVWAYTYTSNVAIASNEEKQVTIDGDDYAAAKTNKGTSATITLPQGVTKIHLHLVAWNGDANSVVTVTGDCFNEAKQLTLVDHENVSGSAAKYDLGASGVDYYFSLTPDNAVAADEVITITAASGKRFVLFGVNQEGGIVPVLQSLAVSGDLENKTYEAGAAINPAGLTVMGTYTLGGTPQAPVDVTDQVEDWLYDALQAGDETVTISAKIGTVTSAGYEITGLTVTDPTPRFETNPTSYISFGSKVQGEDIAARDLEITLVNVSNASVEITGTGAAAFSVDEDALTGNATLHVSASSANVGTFAATLTISDEAGAAADKEISLSLTVTAPVVEETAVSTTSEWVVATDADLVDGAEVLITGATGGVTYAIGVQNDNNRAAVAGTLEEGVFTPGENTMSFTLVAQETEGVFALQASNGEYLYAASSAKNYLKRQATLDDNAKWTLTATSAVANGSNTHNDLKFNATNSPKIFSCYTGGQTAIQFYVPKPVTPTKYNVTIVDMIDNGTVESDKTEAEEGESVTLTITANAGFELTELWVNMDNVVSSVSAGSYTFSMPDEDVTISALFTQIPDPSYTEVRNGLNAGEYYTMCLDKAVISVKAGSIWRVLSKAQNGTDIILEEVEGTLDAGRPYIFRASASTLQVAYTGDAVLAPVNDDDNNGLVGAFEQALIAQSPNNFIIYDNALYYVNSANVFVGAHRAYLDMSRVPAYDSNSMQGNAPRRRVVMTVHGPQVATGIDALNTSDAPVKVLINGQLFIIRGEKMFDAKGQLVK